MSVENQHRKVLELHYDLIPYKWIKNYLRRHRTALGTGAFWAGYKKAIIDIEAGIERRVSKQHKEALKSIEKE